jgi:molybdate transport system substrate-binding protein
MLCAVVWILGCQRAPDSAPAAIPPPAPAVLHVAAAANLKFALDEIEAAFEREHSSIRLELTYGSSGNFFAQLTQRAPFDLFLSADTSYPRRLVEQGLAQEEGYFAYAQGRIVVWVPSTSRLDLDARGMQALLDPSVRKIAIANPELAPYGQAAVAAMKSLGVHDGLADRLVLGENITQAGQFVESGAADAGIIALSLALAPQMKAKGRYWEIPRSAYEPIEQAGVVMSFSQNPAVAAQLRSFLTGPQGQGILARYGYAAPGRSP